MASAKPEKTKSPAKQHLELKLVCSVIPVEDSNGTNINPVNENETGDMYLCMLRNLHMIYDLSLHPENGTDLNLLRKQAR